MTDSKAQLSRFTAIFASGTFLSRIIGLVRDIVLGAMIPTETLGLFFFSFRFPNMLRDMLGEGAANAALIPVFSESKEKDSPKDYRRMVGAVMSAMILVFGGLSILGVLVMPYMPGLMKFMEPFTGASTETQTQLRETILLSQWTFPYLFFIGMAVFAMAPLFVAHHYSTPSWSPVLLNITLILACVALRGYFWDDSWALVVGVWLGGIAQLVVMTWAMHRYVGVLWPNFDLRNPGIYKVFYLLGPVIVGQATGEVNKLVDTMFAYKLGTQTVAALFYANRLIQLPLSIFGIAVSVAILPTISRAGARKEYAAIRETLMDGFRQTAFLVLPAMAGLLVFSEPVVRILFQHGAFGPDDTHRTAIAVFYGALGLLSFAWVKVSVQGFYAIQNTKFPVIIASISMALNIVLIFALVGPLQMRGLILATTISYTVNFLLLYAMLCRRYGPLWDVPFLNVLARMLLCGVGMALVCYFTAQACQPHFSHGNFLVRSVPLLIAGSLGIAAYIAAARILKIPELNSFLSIFSRRRT